MSKFKVGDFVSYRPNSAHSRNAAHGLYEVIRVLPGGQYRIKSAAENHERAADESELTK